MDGIPSEGPESSEAALPDVRLRASDRYALESRSLRRPDGLVHLRAGVRRVQIGPSKRSILNTISDFGTIPAPQIRTRDDYPWTGTSGRVSAKPPMDRERGEGREMHPWLRITSTGFC